MGGFGSSEEMFFVGVGIKANQHGLALAEYRALDHAGIFDHQLRGVGRVGDAVFGGLGQSAPSRAFFIDQHFPGNLFHPVRDGVLVDAGFFEVVEIVSDVLALEPVTRFFYAAAVGDAVEGDHGCLV